MRKITIILLLAINFISSIYAQNSIESAANFDPDTSERITRYAVGFIPSKAENINGLAVGWFFLDALNDKSDSVRVNGAYINPSPLQVLFGAMMSAYVIAYPFYAKEAKDRRAYNDSLVFAENRINGLSIIIMDVGEYEINGLNIACFGNILTELNGLSFGTVWNEYNQFNGVLIAGLSNRTRKGKGLQIGLINHTDEMRGIQIGLWNKIGKRGLPLINMSFKNKK